MEKSSDAWNVPTNAEKVTLREQVMERWAPIIQQHRPHARAVIHYATTATSPPEAFEAEEMQGKMAIFNQARLEAAHKHAEETGNREMLDKLAARGFKKQMYLTIDEKGDPTGFCSAGEMAMMLIADDRFTPLGTELDWTDSAKGTTAADGNGEGSTGARGNPGECLRQLCGSKMISDPDLSGDASASSAAQPTEALSTKKRKNKKKLQKKTNPFMEALSGYHKERTR
jgi:hypothetical protein